MLNERIMSAVWHESSEQAREMLGSFTGSVVKEKDSSHSFPGESGETNGTIEGVRRITINVIGATGYGSRRSWVQAASDVVPSAGYKLTFMEAVMAIVNNSILSVFLPTDLLCWRVMPNVIQTLGAATKEFPGYARDFIAEERRSPSTRKTLIGALVKNMSTGVTKNDEKTADEQNYFSSKPANSSATFSEDEIIGNLFNFTIAGFDTTASTIAYSLMALALEPKWQDWIIEEIDQAAVLNPGVDYEKSFPRMTRCLALMVSPSSFYSPYFDFLQKS